MVNLCAWFHLPRKAALLKQVLPASNGWEPGSSSWLSARTCLTVEKATSEKPGMVPKPSHLPVQVKRERKLYSFGWIMPEVADISRNTILNWKSKPWDTKQVWNNSLMIMLNIYFALEYLCKHPEGKERLAGSHSSIALLSHPSSCMFRLLPLRKSISHGHHLSQCTRSVSILQTWWASWQTLKDSRYRHCSTVPLWASNSYYYIPGSTFTAWGEWSTSDRSLKSWWYHA